MKKTAVSHKPGDIIEIAGKRFVVLDDLSPFSEESEGHDLLILSLESQGESRFGENNNYAESELRRRTAAWLDDLLDHGVDPELIRSRTISLTTLDGYKGYSDLEVKAAPLTLDEARRCAESMPAPGIASWLATGWGGPEHSGATGALFVYTNGNWGYSLCSSAGYAIRPALVVASSLFASVETDLSTVPTEDLLGELRRRIEEE